MAEYFRPNHFFNKRKAMIKIQSEGLEILDTLLGMWRDSPNFLYGAKHPQSDVYVL